MSPEPSQWYSYCNEAVELSYVLLIYISFAILLSKIFRACILSNKTNMKVIVI